MWKVHTSPFQRHNIPSEAPSQYIASATQNTESRSDS
jgi:hypothetical protein